MGPFYDWESDTVNALGRIARQSRRLGLPRIHKFFWLRLLLLAIEWPRFVGSLDLALPWNRSGPITGAQIT